jgi:hypothetical protein
MRKLTKGAIAVTGATVLAVGGGVAWAAWSSTGSGSGSATSTTSANSTISPDASGGALYPGAAKTFTVKVSNPNDYPVVVDTISAGTSEATASGCAAGTVTSDLVSGPSGTIAPHATGTYSLTAHMAADAGNLCQGQTFTLPLTATLSSNAS